MHLYIDKADGRFISDPLFKSPVDSVSFKRGDAASIRISFVSGFAVEPLEDGASIAFGIKEQNKFDGAFLVFTDSYTEDGDSYILAPSFNTEALNEALNVDGNDANDIAALTAMLEVTWSEDGENFQSSRTITANIANDLIRGGEGTPAALPDPEAWLAAHGIVYDRATGLEDVATGELEFGRVHFQDGAFYRLTSGTEATSLPYVVRPTDYATTTNEKYWSALNLRGLILFGRFIYTDNFLYAGKPEENKGQIVLAMDNSTAELAIEPGNLSGSQTAVFPDATGTVAVVPEHYDDAAAAVAGLDVGDLYFSLASNRFRIRTA